MASCRYELYNVMPAYCDSLDSLVICHLYNLSWDIS